MTLTFIMFSTYHRHVGSVKDEWDLGTVVAELSMVGEAVSIDVVWGRVCNAVQALTLAPGEAGWGETVLVRLDHTGLVLPTLDHWLCYVRMRQAVLWTTPYLLVPSTKINWKIVKTYHKIWLIWSKDFSLNIHKDTGTVQDFTWKYKLAWF